MRSVELSFTCHKTLMILMRELKGSSFVSILYMQVLPTFNAFQVGCHQLPIIDFLAYG